MKLIHRAASRSLAMACPSRAIAAADDVVWSVPLLELLEQRQMLSSSALSRSSLSKLHSTLQTTYQQYEQFIAAQPIESSPAKTKKEKAAKALAVDAISTTFQPTDAAATVSGGDVSIEAFANPGDMSLLKAALQKLSGRKVTSSGRQVDATLPVADLGTLATLKSLRFAESDSAVVNVGAVTSQGDIADQAAGVRAGYGINGAGVKIGIISDSFNNNNQGYTDTYSTDVASGDLPAGVEILNDNYPGTDEGRAMAQVIYDSAPGVSFAFASGEGGQTNMASEIQALVNVGCNIIVDDITYENEPMFADGVIAQAAEAAIASGVTYISAAGNLGSNSYASTWRSGPNLSAGSITKDPTALSAPNFYGGVTFNFNTTGGTTDTDSFTLAPGQSFKPSLQWDSPYYSTGGPGTSNQVDCYILNAAGTRIEGGSSVQVTGGDPIQDVLFTNNTSTTNTYQLMICCSIGSVPGYIKWVDFAGQATNWQFAETSSTIFGHANAAGVESVGAVNYASTPAYNTSTPVLESYSGTGGTPIIFSTAGTRQSTYTYRQSPDVVAPDGVFTTFFGTTTQGNTYPTFSGTSASAAGVAGLTALLLQKDPGFENPTNGPSGVQTALNSYTIKMGSTSPNNQSGYGLVQGLPVLANSVGNITGTVFYDNNGNGVADPGEVGISGAIVYIDEYGTGILQTGDPVTTTGYNGSFEFYNQSLGSTVVRLVTLSGYVQTDGAQNVNVSAGQTSSGTYFGLFPIDYAGAYGNYNYLLQNNVAQPGIVNIYVNGTIAYSAPLSILEGSGLTFDLEGGNSSLTVNFAFGDPIPDAGVEFTPTGAGNSLVINGSSAADTAVVDNDVTSFDSTLSNGSSITADDVQNETINGNGGNDVFQVVTAQPIGETLNFNGSNTAPGNATLSVNDALPNNGTTTFFNAGTYSTDQNTLNVSAGTWTFPGNPAATSANLTVNLSNNGNSSDSTVVFAAGAPNSNINTRQLAALNIGAASQAIVTAPDIHSDRAALLLGTLSIAPTGILDLSGNDMIVTTGSLAAISALVGTGYNNGAWTGNGIHSSAAAADTTHLTALGVIQNNVNGTRLYGSGTPLGTFDGMNVSSSAILVKYTYYGDANLTGEVDGSDYSLVDNGYTQKLTGWYNGDFNYDSVVNGSDYTLMDNAFNRQGSGL